jgi:hypothetical protein
MINQNGISVSRDATKKLQISVFSVIAIGIPTALTLSFYLVYAQNAWFFQDDFGFIASYGQQLHSKELLNFNNFGRFISRNIYWHYGMKYFDLQAQYFYVLNFLIILSSSFLIYKIFLKYGRTNALLAGLFYLMLPQTIANYVWLSNSQHILGHFFVILFIFLYTQNSNENDSHKTQTRIYSLILVLVLGLMSNVFVGMALTLPLWAILSNKKNRKFNSNMLLSVIGSLLLFVFIVKLSRFRSGAYITDYSLETFVENLIFYFQNLTYGIIWIVLMAAGTLYSIIRKLFLTSWFFVASGAFFLPFSFFVVQRYPNYGSLTYLFFILGIWSLILNSGLVTRPKYIYAIGTSLIFVLFSYAMKLPINYYSEYPLGQSQRKQIEIVREYARLHPEVSRFCFETRENMPNVGNVSEQEIPGEWWFVGFGQAFSTFVGSKNTYLLTEVKSDCDVVFTFSGDTLSQTDNELG